MLTEKVHAVHTWSQGTYGAPRIHVELREEGVSVGPGCALNASSGLAGYALLAKQELSLPRLLKRLSKYEALIIDDIGYVEQSQIGRASCRERV